jgi:hypothetical protein
VERAVRIAAKQLLALGVKPQEVTVLEAWATENGEELRELVQRLIRHKVQDRLRCPNQKTCELGRGHEGECRAKDGAPARWDDPTYLGTGCWGP